MEFSFNVNNLLPDTITLVDDKLAPFTSRVKNDRSEFANKQSQLKTVIDKMGEASTRAQGLRAPITSAIKLQHSEQRLYIMKDPVANKTCKVYSMKYIPCVCWISTSMRLAREQGVAKDCLSICLRWKVGWFTT